MIRRTVLRLVVLAVLALLVLLTVADRLTESAAAHAVSVKARQAGQLAADPAVSISGFPFLTQAFASRYREVTVTTHGIHRSGLRLETVTGRFRGVHVGLGATLDGDVAGAHIDAASGVVDVAYADLDALLTPRHLRVVDPAAGSLTVDGEVRIGTKLVAVSAPATASATPGVLSITTTAAALRGSVPALTAKQAAGLAASYAVHVPLANLPFGVVVRAAVAGPDGVELTGTAVGLAVPVPSDAAQTGTP